MGGNRDQADQQVVKALSHPLRVEILEALQGRVASAGELSREMGASRGVISYHAHTLLRCGCLELVYSEPRAGTLENFFSAPSHS